VLGYENCAKLAKQAFKENKTIRELVSEQKLIEPAELDRLLDPESMTRPG
jgi:fumarate hydratase class II